MGFNCEVCEKEVFIVSYKQFNGEVKRVCEGCKTFKGPAPEFTKKGVTRKNIRSE